MKIVVRIVPAQIVVLGPVEALLEMEEVKARLLRQQPQRQQSQPYSS